MFNGYCFPCSNFGNIARDYKAYNKDDYQGNYQNTRRKVVGTQDKFSKVFVSINHMSVGWNHLGPTLNVTNGITMGI